MSLCLVFFWFSFLFFSHLTSCPARGVLCWFLRRAPISDKK